MKNLIEEESRIKSLQEKLERSIKTIESDLDREKSISLDADLNEKRISKEKEDLLNTENKLLDVERIIQNPSNVSATQQTTVFTFADETAGYEADRIQFKIKTSGTLDYMTLVGNEDSSTTSLKWDGTLALSSSAFTIIDIPIRDIAVGDTTTIYKDGTGTTFTAATNNTILDVDKLYGSSTHELTRFVIELTASAAVEIKDIYLYKSAEWRVETIRDFTSDFVVEYKRVVLKLL